MAADRLGVGYLVEDAATSLVITDHDRVRTLLLNRPEVANALDEDGVAALTAAVREAPEDGVRLLVLRGAGKHFSGGFELTDGTDQELAHRFLAIQSLLDALRTVPCVTLAFVHGAAYGAAADVVASCDYRVGTAACRFRFPGFQFGVALGTRHLARTIGPTSALDVLLKDRKIDAATAIEQGLLTHLVGAWDDARQLVDEIDESLATFTSARLQLLLANTRHLPDPRETQALVDSLQERGLAARIRSFREG